VLGVKKGLRMLKKFPDYKAIVITDKQEIITSPNFNLEQYKIHY